MSGISGLNILVVSQLHLSLVHYNTYDFMNFMNYIG